MARAVTCYLFAGGGTGGHLTPGLAVAAELRQRDPACRIVFAGTDRDVEKSMIASAGYGHVSLPVESSQTLRRNPFRFVWGNWLAFRQGRRLVDLEKPAGVIGLAGFASVPTVLAATRRKLPTVILEQNVIPGRATRFLCRRAGAVCASFEGIGTLLRPGARTVVTGNPVRAGIAGIFRCPAPSGGDRPPMLLVLGGSQGAESLNDAVAAMLERKPPELAGWRIVHQTGAAQHEEIARRYRTLGPQHVAQAFFDDMPAVYASATLAVSRAGATTLAELACAGLPAILLPYPHAADNHQLANARVFEQAGAAVVVEHDTNSAVTADNLSRAVAAVAGDPSHRAAMQRSLRPLARPDAARDVADVLQTLITKGTA